MRAADVLLKPEEWDGLAYARETIHRDDSFQKLDGAKSSCQ